MTARYDRSSLHFLLIVIALGLAVATFLYLSSSSAEAAPDDKTRTETEAASEAVQEPPVEEPPAEGEEKAGEAKNGKAPIPVKVARADRGSVAAYLNATSNLVPEDEVVILAEAEGRVTELRVEEGQRVERGAMLAGLLRGDAEIALEKARARAANAQLAHQRAEQIHRQELISREEYDQLRMENQVAVQELAEAEWQLAKRTIRAPFSGYVTERLVTLGQDVRPGDPLFKLADFEPLVARIYLPEKDVLGMGEGTEVSLSLNADPSVTFVGRIRRISPVVDTATGTVKVTVEAVEPPSEVRPGGFVTVHIVRQRREGVVLIPRQCLIRELQRAHVFVTDGQVAERRAVTLGLEEGDLVEALSGVEAGERVVTAGQGGLKDGAAIEILEGSSSAEQES